MKTTIAFLSSFIIILCMAAQAQSGFVFPFDTTSRWEYDVISSFDPFHPGHTTLRFLEDTKMPNGRIYKPFSNGFHTIIYLRKDSSRIFQYWDTTEFIRYDFSRLPGDTLSEIFKPTDGIVVLTGSQVKIVFGSSKKVMSFQSSNAMVWDDVADTIGILNFNPGGTDVMYQLTGASVNGQIYGVTTHVSNITQLVPKNPSLAQNYPNPFNPSTTFTFVLPSRSRSIMTVYNALGSVVTKLIDSDLDSGTHTVIWDASGYSSGVYFYTLQTGNFRLTKRMLLLK
jgi:Secretion system C-terminal sorting domain